MKPDRAMFLLIAAVVVYQTMIPPVVSLANNGDFGKISGHFSIGYEPGLEARYAPLKFHEEARYEYHASFRSTENLLAIAAMGLSWAVLKSGEFDIRAIGAIHEALFLLAIWLALPVLASLFSPGARIAMLAAILIVFCDPLYAAVFNTFYMDAAALVFVLLTLVFFLRSLLWRRTGDVAGFLASACLLAGAKPQHTVLAVPLVFLMMVFRKKIGTRAAIAGAAGVIAAASWCLLSTPPDYKPNQWYDVIFLGTLPYSPAPQQDLREFGLDPADAAYTRTSAFYSTGGFASPEFTRKFWKRIDGGVVLRFYSRHPARAFEMLLRGFDDAGKTRPQDLGNFDPAEGFPPYSRSRAFSAWSQLRAALFARHGLRYFLVTIAIVAILAFSARGRYRVPAYCLAGAVLLEAAVSGLADAAEAPRHFTIFCELEDLCVLALLAGVLRRFPLGDRAGHFRHPYGARDSEKLQRF